MYSSNNVIQVIRLILKGYKYKNDEYQHVLKSVDDQNNEYYLWNCDYLLNQVIRQYNVPQNHYYYSEKARELFNGHLKVKNNELKTFKDCYYREQLICISTVEGRLYKGAANTPYNKAEEGKFLIKKDREFPFKDAFHLEHIIPITKIIEKLEKLNPDTCSDSDIANILDTICVARITKEEDRDMHNKDKRGDTFEDVYKNLYNRDGNHIQLYRNSDDEPVKLK